MDWSLSGPAVDRHFDRQDSLRGLLPELNMFRIDKAPVGRAEGTN
jgi:hypothetical protein